MRKVIIIVLLLTIANATPFAQAGKIPVGGKDRDYIVYAPNELPANPPLVLALHPLGATNTAFRTMSGWDKVADNEKIVIAYPQGITSVSMGGSNMIGWDITADTDVNFMLAVIDTMAARYKIDRNRVYSTGFSMGGMLSYVLACKKSDKIAAIGSDAGFPVGQNASSCTPSVPVPVCHVHGAKDDFVKYTELPPWINKFASVNKCQSSPKTTTGDKYTKDDYSPCDKENEVILYSITAMSHEYATSSKHGFSATDTFWTFFKRHSRGVVVGTQKQIIGAPMEPMFSAVYLGGEIHIAVKREINLVQMFDIHGRTMYARKHQIGRFGNLVVPVGLSSGGICIVKVSGSSGSSVKQILIP